MGSNGDGDDEDIVVVVTTVVVDDPLVNDVAVVIEGSVGNVTSYQSLPRFKCHPSRTGMTLAYTVVVIERTQINC